MKNKIFLFFGLKSHDLTYDWIPFSPLIVAAILESGGFETIVIHEFSTPNYEKIIKDNIDDLLFLGITAAAGVQILSGI